MLIQINLKLGRPIFLAKQLTVPNKFNLTNVKIKIKLIIHNKDSRKQTNNPRNILAWKSR